MAIPRKPLKSLSIPWHKRRKVATENIVPQTSLSFDANYAAMLSPFETAIIRCVVVSAKQQNKGLAMSFLLTLAQYVLLLFGIFCFATFAAGKRLRHLVVALLYVGGFLLSDRLDAWWPLVATVVSVWAILTFILKPERNLLSVKVTTEDGFAYNVHYKPLGDDVETVEWLWLCLLFPAKMLFNAGDSKEKKYAEERGLILITLEMLVQSAWSSANEVLELCNSGVSVSEGHGGGREVSATLSFRDSTTRSITTAVPTRPFEHQFYGSVVAVIATTADRLPDYQREILQKSLLRMVALYRQHGTSSLKSLVTIPRQSFVETITTRYE